MCFVFSLIWSDRFCRSVLEKQLKFNEQTLLTHSESLTTTHAQNHTTSFRCSIVCSAFRILVAPEWPLARICTSTKSRVRAEPLRSDQSSSSSLLRDKNVTSAGRLFGFCCFNFALKLRAARFGLRRSEKVPTKSIL